MRLLSNPSLCFKGCISVAGCKDPSCFLSGIDRKETNVGTNGQKQGKKDN